MGFYHRRRRRLSPGARAIVDLTGMVIGLGVALHYSRRGSQATFGLSDRRTTRQREADERRAAVVERVSSSSSVVFDEKLEQERFLNCWRDAPGIPSMEGYLQSAVPRPYTATPGPTPLNEKEERARLRQEIQPTIPIPSSLPWFPSLVWAGGVAAAAAVFCITVLGFVPPVLLEVIVVTITLQAWLRQALNRIRVERRVREQWPGRWHKITNDHKAKTETHEKAIQEEQSNWKQREQDRVGWVTRLLNGDEEAISETIADSLSDLDFPFEAKSQVAVTEPTQAYLLFDLPEIEDVIAETKKQVLKSGQIKETKRTITERNKDYAHLVLGLILFVGRCAFESGPTLRQVTIAAYTQRRKARSGVIRDDFVCEITLTREKLSQIDVSTIDPVAFLNKPSQRIDMRDNNELRRIDPPSWADELFDQGDATEGTSREQEKPTQREIGQAAVLPVGTPPVKKVSWSLWHALWLVFFLGVCSISADGRMRRKEPVKVPESPSTMP